MNATYRPFALLATSCAVALFVSAGIALRVGFTKRIGTMKANTVRTARGLQCGHFALLRACQLLGVITSEAEVLKAMPQKALGHSFTDLRNAAERMNVQADGFVADWSAVIEGPVPVILHLREPEHYVVLARADDHQPVIFDGTGKRQVVTADSICCRWSGAVLRLSKKKHTTSVQNRRAGDPAPRIEFDTLIIDKGQLAHGTGSMEFKFPVRNSGSAPLEIGSVKTSCGCLASDYPHVIEPGGKGTITLKYTPNYYKRSLEIIHDAQVMSNDPRFSRVRISALASLDGRVFLYPRELKFESIPNGTKATAYVFAYYRGEATEPFRLTLSESLPDGISLRTIDYEEYVRAIGTPDILRDEAATPERKQYLELTIDPTVFKHFRERFSGTLSLKTSIPDIKVVGIPYSGKIVPAVEAMPRLLAFEVGGEAVARIRLKSARDFTVVSCSDGAFNVSAVPRSSNIEPYVAELEIRVPPERASQLHGHSIRITAGFSDTDFKEMLELQTYVVSTRPTNAN